MSVTLKQYDELVERHHPIIFLDKFLSTPLYEEEGRRLVEADTVKRIVEYQVNVLVLHTKG